eukprot:15359349-Ditylum_brightwellii.AAC.1
MSVLVNHQKHYKAKNAESGSGFDPPAIPFIPRASSLKLENAQEFSLWVSPAEKKSTYKYKAVTFSNGSPEDEFKQVETSRTSKNPDGRDTDPKGVCDETFKVCLQELKKHYFPKDLARLQKAYLCNHIHKPNELSIKNTAARLRDVNDMLARFPAPDNNPMADDELCSILYQMIKHKWQEAL